MEKLLSVGNPSSMGESQSCSSRGRNRSGDGKLSLPDSGIYRPTRLQGQTDSISHDSDTERSTDRISSPKHQFGGMDSMPLDSNSTRDEPGEKKSDAPKKGMGSLVANNAGDLQYLGEILPIPSLSTK